MMSVASSTTPGIERKFVQHAFDLHGGDGRAFDGAQQRAPQRVANRGAPTALKRLRGKLSVLIGERFGFSRETLWFLKTLPHTVAFLPGRGTPL